MKVAVIADLHANGPALERIIAECSSLDVDQFWFLGDLFGRGPNPCECLAWLMDTVHLQDSNTWVMGNHDAMLVDLLNDEQWSRVNEEPRVVIPKHRELVKKCPADQEFIEREFNPERLQPKLLAQDGSNHWITHNGLVDYPGYYRYDYPWYDESILPGEFEELARRNPAPEKPAVIWFGHSHVPSLIAARLDGERYRIIAKPVFPGETYSLKDHTAWMINPGSAGQPRDLDQRAAFALLDTEQLSVTFRRVSYDWKKTARMIQREAYPEKLVRILRDATPDKDIPEYWLDHFKKAREVADG
jgi:predicted phosphodiesterase